MHWKPRICSDFWVKMRALGAVQIGSAASYFRAVEKT